MRRSEQRRAAVVALYQHDLTGRALSETHAPGDSSFARELASGAAERRLRAGGDIIGRDSAGSPASVAG